MGQRVVIRRLLRGESGPTGGPAFTDVLGVLEQWPADAAGDVIVHTESGEFVTFARGDIVSGKAVPPRPSVRMRISPVDLQRRVVAMWRGIEIRYVGNWLVLTQPGSDREDIAMAIGDPGVPIDEAVSAIVETGRSRVRVLADSPEQDAFVAAGWMLADEPIAAMYVAGVSRVLRAHGSQAQVARREGEAYVADGSRICATLDDEWLGLNGFTHGPGTSAVLLTALEAGAEQGALNAFIGLHVDGPAVAALEGLGFAEHHRYRYVVR